MAERSPGVKNFTYADDLLDELAALSRERLGTYLDATGGDREGAIRLYAWNTAVSAAFYGPLQGLEVEVVGWITPGTRKWVEHHSRIPAILDTARNAAAIRF